METWIAPDRREQRRHWDEHWLGLDARRSTEDLLEGLDTEATLLDRLLEYAGTGRVLDHGVGLGRAAAYLRRAGCTVVGVDFATEGLRIARDLDSTTLLLSCDIRSMPVPPDVFDSAVSLGVVEHLGEGPLEALRELRRAIAPGGHALVTVPFENLWRRTWSAMRLRGAHIRHGYDVRRSGRLEFVGNQCACFYQYAFRRREFLGLLQQAGFSVDAVVPFRIAHGLAQTRLGSRVFAILRSRFGRTNGGTSPGQGVRGPRRARLRSYLRSLYDENDATGVARCWRRIGGPVFGQMQAYFLTAA